MTIIEAAAALRARRISSVELTRAALERIDRLNPELNAFLTVTAEPALARAGQADAELARGTDLGPLHGIPIALKDLYFTRGVRTTNGSKLFEDFVPQCDGTVVEKLAAAGAVFLGKTGMHECAYGITSNNPHFGPVRNPQNPECIPGGSSGGSGTAVAADLSFMAMGSDTGGSIRIPAAYCGTVGLKPTFGRVSRWGAFQLGYSLDHMGPLTRSVRDAAVTLNAIAGFDPRDDTSSRRPAEDFDPGVEPSVRGIRAGIPENFYFERLETAVEQGVRRMIAKAEQLGAEIVSVCLPDVDALNAISRVILLAEASAIFEPLMHRRDEIGPDVRALLDQGRLVRATDYLNAQRIRRQFQREFNRIWKQVDCLLAPTTPNCAPKIGQPTVTIGDHTEDVRLMATRLVRGINVLGWPAIALPCGTAENGLPVSLQVIGRPFREAAILRIAAALEHA